MSSITRLIAETPATAEGLRHLAAVVEGARQAADPVAAMAAIESCSPFAWLLKWLPEDKMEAYTFISMIAGVLSLVATVVFGVAEQRDKPVPTITPDQVEEIVKRVIEHQEQLHEPDVPDPTPREDGDDGPPGQR